MIKIYNVEQTSPEWFKLREGKITGSVFHRVMVNKDTWIDNAKKLISSDFKPNFVETDDIKRGNRLESEAFKVYEIKKDVKVSEVGFITNSIIKIVGVSPDGVIYTGNTITGAIEIKCRNKENFEKFKRTKTIKRPAMMQIVCYFTVIDTLEYVDYVEYSETAKYNENLQVVRVYREDVLDDIVKAKERLLILEKEVE